MLAAHLTTRFLPLDLGYWHALPSTDVRCSLSVCLWSSFPGDALVSVSFG